MYHERVEQGGIDYRPCHYGASKLTFRGPAKALDSDYVAFLGSTETYGKSVRTPFPDLVQQELGVTAVNLGCVNGGVDAYGADPTVSEICRGATACVVQVMGAHKLSNPLYAVHGRRNDRVLGPTPALQALYPEVDFAEIHFARHLVSAVAKAGPARFALVRQVLKDTWLSRMTRLIEASSVPVILLWLSDRNPEHPGDDPDSMEPLFVDQAMLDALVPRPVEMIRVSLAEGGAVDAGLSGLQREAIAQPGPEVHRRITAAVCEALKRAL